MRSLVIAIALLCSCTKNTRNTTIQTSLTAANAAQSALATFDLQHQTDLVNQAKDKASGEAALQAWRGQRLTLEMTLDSLYRAIALAAIGSDATSLTAMINAAAVVAQELASLGVKVP